MLSRQATIRPHRQRRTVPQTPPLANAPRERSERKQQEKKRTHIHSIHYTSNLYNKPMPHTPTDTNTMATAIYQEGAQPHGSPPLSRPQPRCPPPGPPTRPNPWTNPSTTSGLRHDHHPALPSAAPARARHPPRSQHPCPPPRLASWPSCWPLLPPPGSRGPCGGLSGLLANSPEGSAARARAGSSRPRRRARGRRERRLTVARRHRARIASIRGGRATARAPARPPHHGRSRPWARRPRPLLPISWPACAPPAQLLQSPASRPSPRYLPESTIGLEDIQAFIYSPRSRTSRLTLAGPPSPLRAPSSPRVGCTRLDTQLDRRTYRAVSVGRLSRYLYTLHRSPPIARAPSPPPGPHTSARPLPLLYIFVGGGAPSPASRPCNGRGGMCCCWRPRGRCQGLVL